MMKTWFFFMTLLLAPFWTFGKEKSKDQAETEKDEQKVPELQLPTCYFEVEVEPESWTYIAERPCANFHPVEITILPLSYYESLFSDELQQQNDVIGDEEFINHLNQLGILKRMDSSTSALCVRDNNER